MSARWGTVCEVFRLGLFLGIPGSDLEYQKRLFRNMKLCSLWVGAIKGHHFTSLFRAKLKKYLIIHVFRTDQQHCVELIFTSKICFSEDIYIYITFNICNYTTMHM